MKDLVPYKKMDISEELYIYGRLIVESEAEDNNILFIISSSLCNKDLFPFEFKAWR